MIFTFDDEPMGFHPFYRRPRRHVVSGWDDFVRPALETVNTLNHMLQLANANDLEPRIVRSLASQRAEQSQDKFEVKMDVQQFAPEELDVKMIDNFVVVEGKHEERQDDHGFISRHFVRRYKLPDDVKPENVSCNLSSDGILCVSAPRMIEQKPANERNVPINFTGKPALNEKSQEPNANAGGENKEAADAGATK